MRIFSRLSSKKKAETQSYSFFLVLRFQETLSVAFLFSIKALNKLCQSLNFYFLKEFPIRAALVAKQNIHRVAATAKTISSGLSWWTRKLAPGPDSVKKSSLAKLAQN